MKRTPPSQRRALLDIDQAADYLGISARTMKTLHETRQVAHVRLGKRTLRFDPDDLDAYVDAQRVSARSA